MVCPGGVRPAGLVGTGDAGDVAEPLAAAADVVGWGVVGFPDGAAVGAGDGDSALPRCGPGSAGPATPRPGACPLAVTSLRAAAAVACGAAHRVNGACGPPAIASTRAPRQMVSATAETEPIRRMTRRRRPDGSAKTGLECTSGV